MYFEESESLAREETGLRPLIVRVDEALGQFSEQNPVNPQWLSQQFDEAEGDVREVCKLLERAGLLRKEYVLECDCSNLIRRHGEDDGTQEERCSSCGAELHGKLPAAAVYFLNRVRSASVLPGHTAKVLIGLHGIRSHGAWYDALGDVVQVKGWKMRINRWKFGKFLAIRLVFPGQRLAKVQWFREQYEAERSDSESGIDYESHRYPSIVAHSFGTYILGNALLKYKHIRFNKVILCGSILPEDFPWDQLIDRGQVQFLRNEYGVNDYWVKLCPIFVANSGWSGLSGFTLDHPRIQQEQFLYDHSEYFEKGHIRQCWLSALEETERLCLPCDRKVDAPQLRVPIAHWLLVGMLLAAVVWYVWYSFC